MEATEQNTSNNTQPSMGVEEVVWGILRSINDPEIPVISIVDLGIVRAVSVEEHHLVKIIITPTYSGCPAHDVIKMTIQLSLLENNIKNFCIEQRLFPAWTTDWISDSGRQKLKAYGIAPPNYTQAVCMPEIFQKEESVQCPHCNSFHTIMISQFGSTACKALYKCEDCKEPFDYFKCH